MRDDASDGKVDLLVQIGGNLGVQRARPTSISPPRWARSETQRADRAISYNETSRNICQWHLPQAHYLESWSDARAFDGTASVVQPLIMPLYEGRTVPRTAGHTLALEQTARGAYDIVRGQWQATHPGDGFEKAWRKVDPRRGCR